MLHTPHRRRALLAGLLTVATALVTTVTPAAARPTPAAGVFILAQLRTGCVTVGGTAAGRTIKVTQRRQGTKLATFTEVAVADSVVSCSLKPIRAGDVLTVTEVAGAVTTSRKVPVPDLRAEVLPSTQSLRVSYPEAGVTVGFELTALVAGLYSAGGTISSASTDANGEAVWSPGIPFVSAFGRGTFTTALELFSIVDGTPSLAVIAGSSIVRGTGSYGDTVTVRLTSSAGKLKATATASIVSGEEPRFKATLRNAQGAKVKAAPGDRISLSTIPGKRFTVKANTLQVDPADGGSLTAACADGESFVVVFDGATVGHGSVPGDGAITLDPISPLPGALPAGSKVQVGCQDAFGLGQVMTVVTQ